MGSFLGCKVLGVNTQTRHPVEAMMLAEYLTSEQAQLRRFEALGYDPSNINAAASPAVAADLGQSHACHAPGARPRPNSGCAG